MIHVLINTVLVCFAIIGFTVVVGVLVGYVLQLQGRDGRN